MTPVTAARRFWPGRPPVPRRVGKRANASNVRALKKRAMSPTPPDPALAAA